MSTFILVTLAVEWIAGLTPPQTVGAGPSQEEVARQLTKPSPEIKVDNSRPDRPVIGLRIPYYNATDVVLERLAALPELQELRVLESQSGLNRLPYSDRNVTDSGVGHLRKLRKLRILSIPSPWVTDKGMGYIGQMTQLEELEVGNQRGWEIRGSQAQRAHDDMYTARITDKGLQHLKALSHLRTLALFGTCISDDGLRSLAGIGQLENLSLVLIEHGITERGLAHLKQVRTLRSVTVDDLIWSPDAGGMNSSLAFLKELPALESLTIFSLRVTDEGLVHVGRMCRLQNLHLYHAFAPMPVTDAGLEHLKELKQLRSLRLGIESVSDRGLATLSTFSNLEKLDISSLTTSSISESGVLHLSRLCCLRELRLPTGGRVTSKGIEQLHKSLPDLKVLDPSP
jgi:hypothetical protein